MKKIIASLLLSASLCVSAQVIELVTGGGPGSPNDIFARKVAEVIEKNSNLNIVVVPKVGASFNIAFQYLHYTKKPTLTLGHKNIITNKDNTTGYPDGLVDMIKPIAYMGEYNSIIVTSINSGIKTYQDLEDLSKVRSVRVGYGGKNSNSEDVVLRMCKVMNCLQVPYKNASTGLVDLNSNTIDVFPIASLGGTTILSSNLYVPLKTFYLNNWNILFSKNLSTAEEKIIINIINNQDGKFFEDLGLVRTKKSPEEVWSNALKQL